MKLRKKIFKFLTGINPENLIIKSNNHELTPISPNSELTDNYLYDFKNFQSQYNGNIVLSTYSTDSDGDNNLSNKNLKIKIKPIDVLNELETIPNPFSLTLLDEKIEMLKEKAKLIVQHYSKREVEGLIERLENRKKYNDFKNFFSLFQNTNDEKIDLLLNKYQLVLKTSDIFIPEFPNEAIVAMKEYTDAMLKLCNKKPLFYVIATEDNFHEKYKQRDPILLVQSPFGFYWQIIGAWDKEMLMLSEL